jgi:hypothetical protein
VAHRTSRLQGIGQTAAILVLARCVGTHCCDAPHYNPRNRRLINYRDHTGVQCRRRLLSPTNLSLLSIYDSFGVGRRSEFLVLNTRAAGSNGCPQPLGGKKLPLRVAPFQMPTSHPLRKENGPPTKTAQAPEVRGRSVLVAGRKLKSSTSCPIAVGSINRMRNLEHHQRYGGSDNRKCQNYAEHIEPL